MEPRSDWAAFSSRRERDEGEKGGNQRRSPRTAKDPEGPEGGLKRGMNGLVRGGWAEKNEGVRTEACRRIETFRVKKDGRWKV